MIGARAILASHRRKGPHVLAWKRVRRLRHFVANRSRWLSSRASRLQIREEGGAAVSFIEFTVKGKRIAITVESILAVHEHEEGCSIDWRISPVITDQNGVVVHRVEGTFDTVMARIRSASRS